MVDLCSVGLLIPSAPGKTHYTHFSMDLPVHFFPWISRFLGSLGTWCFSYLRTTRISWCSGENLGSAGNRQLPMFAWKNGEIGSKQGTAAASKGLKPWKK